MNRVPNVVLTLTLILALLGVGSAAVTQHGAGQSDPQEHYKQLAEQLELTAEQREKLAGSFHDAFAALQELHRLHAVFEAELSSEQMTKLAEMVHQMFGPAHRPDEHSGGHHPE